MSDQDDIEDEDISDLFAFAPSERELLETVSRSIRRRLPSLAPAVLKDVAVFLHALERLPCATTGVGLDLGLMTRRGEELSYVSVEIGDDRFRLVVGGHAYSPDVGGDSYSETVFEAETGGYRDGNSDDFRHWLEIFVASEGEIEIDGCSDDDIDLAEEAPADAWDRLYRYWESRVPDD